MFTMPRPALPDAEGSWRHNVQTESSVGPGPLTDRVAPVAHTQGRRGEALTLKLAYRDAPETRTGRDVIRTRAGMAAQRPTWHSQRNARAPGGRNHHKRCCRSCFAALTAAPAPPVRTFPGPDITPIRSVAGLTPHWQRPRERATSLEFACRGRNTYQPDTAVKYDLRGVSGKSVKPPMAAILRKPPLLARPLCGIA